MHDEPAEAAARAPATVPGAPSDDRVLARIVPGAKEGRCDFATNEAPELPAVAARRAAAVRRERPAANMVKRSVLFSSPPRIRSSTRCLRLLFWMSGPRQPARNTGPRACRGAYPNTSLSSHFGRRQHFGHRLKVNDQGRAHLRSEHRQGLIPGKEGRAARKRGE